MIAGAELSEVDIGLPRNSLLLQLADGWYMHPPAGPAAAESLQTSSSLHRQRTSSVSRGRGGACYSLLCKIGR